MRNANLARSEENLYNSLLSAEASKMNVALDNTIFKEEKGTHLPMPRKTPTPFQETCRNYQFLLFSLWFFKR